jgi:hypothetical protein
MRAHALKNGYILLVPDKVGIIVPADLSTSTSGGGDALEYAKYLRDLAGRIEEAVTQASWRKEGDKG